MDFAADMARMKHSTNISYSESAKKCRIDCIKIIIAPTIVPKFL